MQNRTGKEKNNFWQVNMLSKRSKVDLILALNEVLQKSNLPAYIRFCKLRYSQLGAILALLTLRLNVEEILKN